MAGCASQEKTDGSSEGVASVDGALPLKTCLDKFCELETLGEDDLWYCPQCKVKQIRPVLASIASLQWYIGQRCRTVPW